MQHSPVVHFIFVPIHLALYKTYKRMGIGDIAPLILNFTSPPSTAALRPAPIEEEAGVPR
jgi:hypothetical protein